MSDLISSDDCTSTLLSVALVLVPRDSASLFHVTIVLTCGIWSFNKHAVNYALNFAYYAGIILLCFYSPIMLKIMPA